MGKRKLIWCEVTCSRCNAMSVASGYYSPERIKRIKEDIKDWGIINEYDVVCPECKKKYETK